MLSSGKWMTVVWKQGLYNYKDPFSLSAQAWARQGETPPPVRPSVSVVSVD